MTRGLATGLALLAAVSATVAGTLLLRAFDPNAAHNPFLPCTFHALTGWYCPGCGITRALHALVHTDLRRALAMNAFFVLSLPLLTAMTLQWTTRRMLLPAAVRRFAFDGRWWIAALLVFGFVRNLPGFEWLAPGGSL